jgi:hypothetical protein
MRATAGAVAPVIACRPSGYSATMQPEGLALRDRQGRLLGLAAPASPGRQPYLELRAETGRYRVRDVNGRPVARCPHPGVG